MSRLANQLQITMDDLKLSGRALEARAGLPGMTVTGIVKNESHPRPERMGKLIAAVPQDHAHRLLEAYLLDDCPEKWVPCVQILIEGQATPTATIKETPGTYRARPSTASQARQVLDQMRHAIDNGDTDLAEWLAQTGTLLVQPHLEQDPTAGE